MDRHLAAYLTSTTLGFLLIAAGLLLFAAFWRAERIARGAFFLTFAVVSVLVGVALVVGA